MRYEGFILYQNPNVRLVNDACKLCYNGKEEPTLERKLKYRENKVKEGHESVLEHSNIAEGVTIGPFAHVRPKTNLMKKVHIGNFVETKNSTLNEGVKAGHLTYIGDSIVGENTNFGAGTITCNYDGKNKYQTIIGKNVFIGSDTKFVAPVVVGDDAITAAGSVITKNIPDRALAVARAKQENKKEWKKK